MTHRFINQLAENEKIDEIFLVGDKQLRQNRNGNLYLLTRLSDRTGALTAMLWNATEKTGNDFQSGDYVRVVGATQVFNGALQVIAQQVERAQDGSYEEEDYIYLSPKRRDALVAQLRDLFGHLSNEPLRKLAEAFLNDETFMAKFTVAPAAVKNHHAQRGGLLEHVVSLMTVAKLAGDHYEALDCDLLVMGAFLHDIGKLDELSYERDLAYTDEGQLLGHLVMGVSSLDQQLHRYEQQYGERFPDELALQLKHMIVSHHGKHEFGSPKLPMTLEAIALHYLDDLDAKMNTIVGLIEEDVNADSRWTTYNPNLARKFFKGSRPSGVGNQEQSVEKTPPLS